MTQTKDDKKLYHAKKGKITDLNELRAAEAAFRKFPENEFVPFAQQVRFEEIVNLLKDSSGEPVNGKYRNPLYIFETRHVTTVGVAELIRKAASFLEESKENYPMDVLSISAGVDGNQLSLQVLIRAYTEKPVRIKRIFTYLGEVHSAGLGEEASKSRFLVPETAHRKISQEEKEYHQQLVHAQDQLFEISSEEEPFLNQIESYTPRKLYEINPTAELEYDLRTRDMDIQLNMGYDDFIKIFQECMQYITANKKDNYYAVLRGREEKVNFYNIVDAHIRKHYIDTQRLPQEDLPALKAKLERALFDLYIVQDLIDDPMITDVKITDPRSIRVRVHGRAYLSNITFIDAEDYYRFINGIAVLNNIDLNVPTQTFTDEQDENYILRFSLTAPYITSTGYPIIHIRKIPRQKPMSKELIEAGMMNEKIRDYLIDCGRFSKGIVFAGPPGSGKTTALNWFLEDGYESSAEILVIQENDELFSYRKGVMFEHVVMNPQHGERACTLEDLGKMALVAGANVFVIGEAKGSEITSAITLSNSGCRTAITIHSQSSTDTIDKMTDLAMRGTANITYDQAKRMIKSFQTIVYMEDYQIKEISEIIGYDEKKRDMIYRPIYRAPQKA